MKKRGFTLMEIMAGLLIMSIIMAISVPSMRGMANRSKENALKQSLYNVRFALARVREDSGGYPLQLTDLTLRTAPANLYNDSGVSTPNANPSRWRGPYLFTIPNDPVSGSSYTYSVSSSGLLNLKSSATGNDSAGNAFSKY